MCVDHRFLNGGASGGSSSAKKLKSRSSKTKFERRETKSTLLFERNLPSKSSNTIQNKSPPSSRPTSHNKYPDLFDKFLAMTEDEENIEDEHQANCQSLPVQNSLPFNAPTTWWSKHEETYPNLIQWAYDILSIPTMSAECERVFSGCNLLLEPCRNRLQDDIVEANECLRV